MKSAYKWRITNSKYVYITDEYNYGPFIYDKTTQTRVYENTGATERADDAVIADVVSELTLEEYTERFNQMKILMETDEETSRVKLLDVSYYYDFNNDECVLKAAEPECEGYTPIISISATSLNYDEQPTANVEVFYSDIDKTVRYNVTVGIPKGEKGDQGSAGTGSTIQINMYPNGSGAYDKPVHTQYIEESESYDNLYNHLHLAPITDSDVIDEKSCVKDGQVVTFVEDSILTIDYKETNAQNINASGDMNIGGNIEVSGTTNIYGQLTVQSGITADKDITTEGNISGKTITAAETLKSNGDLSVQGNSNVDGNSTVSGDLSVVGDTNLNGTTNINGDITLSEPAKTTIGQIAVPVGTIMLWPTNEPPEGWLICDGKTALATYEMASTEDEDTIKLYPPVVYISKPASGTYFQDGGVKKYIRGIYSTQYLTSSSTQSNPINNINIIYSPYSESNPNTAIQYNVNITYRGDNRYFINNAYEVQTSDANWRNIVTKKYQFENKEEYPFLGKLKYQNPKFVKLFQILQQQDGHGITNSFCYPSGNTTNFLFVTTPNLSTRFVLGGNEGNVLGMMGGSENVKLEVRNIPAHYHNVRNGTDGSRVGRIASEWDEPGSYGYSTDTGHGNNQDCNGEPFSILPPYMILNYIIKYK